MQKTATAFIFFFGKVVSLKIPTLLVVSKPGFYEPIAKFYSTVFNKDNI